MLSVFEQYEISLVLQDFTDQVLDAIKNKQIKRQRVSGQSFSAPVMATGKLYDSVQSVFYDEGGRVICEKYIENLIFGQPPGEQPDVSDIQQWMNAKGISGNAQGIADKIWKDGNSIWLEHQGKDSGLLADINIQSSIERLTQKLTEKYANQVASEIVQQFKIAA